MKAIKFLLGLAFVFGIEHCSLFAAADGVGGSLKPDSEQAILDDELISEDDGKDEAVEGFVYWIINPEAVIQSKCPDGGIFIRPGYGPFYPVDPRKIYQLAVKIGLEPPAASFLKVPVKRLQSEEVIVRPWFVSDDHVFLMNVKKQHYRNVLRTRFFDFYEKRKLYTASLPEAFDLYFDKDFLQFGSDMILSETMTSYHLKLSQRTEAFNYFFSVTNYFIYVDKYLPQKLVDVTGLEPIAWSDPFE